MGFIFYLPMWWTWNYSPGKYANKWANFQMLQSAVLLQSSPFFQCFCHIIQILVFIQYISFKLILGWQFPSRCHQWQCLFQFYTCIAPRKLQLIFYKGIMSWDFQHQVFFMNSFSYGSWYPVHTISKIFKNLWRYSKRKVYDRCC